MKKLSRAVVVLGMLLAVKDASAEDAPPEPKWSIGGGIGIGVVNGTEFYTSYGGAVIVERRLSHRLWLTLDPYANASSGASAQIGYDTNGNPTPSAQANASLNAGTNAGLRYVLNPGGAVEVSPVFNVSLGYSSWTPELIYPSITSNSTSTTVGTNVGIAFEHQLLPNLYLRFATTLFAVSYSWGSTRYSIPSTGLAGSADGTVSALGGASPARVSTHSFNAGLSISPSLSLRLAI